eukprot:745086-Pyramimonas_sp.AAC.1
MKFEERQSASKGGDRADARREAEASTSGNETDSPLLKHEHVDLFRPARLSQQTDGGRGNRRARFSKGAHKAPQLSKTKSDGAHSFMGTGDLLGQLDRPHELEVAIEPIMQWWNYLLQCHVAKKQGVPGLKTFPAAKMLEYRELEDKVWKFPRMMNSGQAEPTPQGLTKLQHRQLVLALYWLFADCYLVDNALVIAETDWDAEVGGQTTSRGQRMKFATFLVYIRKLLQRFAPSHDWSPKGYATIQPLHPGLTSDTRTLAI